MGSSVRYSSKLTQPSLLTSLLVGLGLLPLGRFTRLFNTICVAPPLLIRLQSSCVAILPPGNSGVFFLSCFVAITHPPWGY